MQPNWNRGLSEGQFFSAKRLRELFFLSLLGGILGLLVWHFVPKHWQATMLIQVGQAGDGVPIADPSSVAAGVQFPSFVTQVVEEADIGSVDEARGKLVKKSLWATVLKGAPLIEIGVEAYSREGATHVLATVLSMLQKKHSELLAPATARRQSLLDNNKRTLATLEAQRASIMSRLESSAVRDGSAFSQSVLLADLLHSIDGQEHELTAQTALLSEQLSSQKTFNTRVISPIYSPVRPSSSPARFYFVWGGLLGAAVWVSLRLMRDAEFRIAVRQSVFGAPAHV